MTSAPAAVTRHVATLLAVLQRLDAALAAAVEDTDALPRGAPCSLLDPDEHPEDSRFRLLADVHGLSPVELDLLLLAVAPQLDARYGELFGALQSDLTRLRPTVALALDLLGLTRAQRVGAQHALAPGARLVTCGLLRVVDPPGRHGCPVPQRELVVDDRLAGFLTGQDGLDASLTGVADVVDVEPAMDRLLLSPAVHDRLVAVQQQPSRLCLLNGPDGSGRQGVAEVLAQAWGLAALVRVQTDRLLVEDPDRFADLVRRIGREARLRNAATYWERFDVLLEGGREQLLGVVQAESARLRHVFLSAAHEWPARDRPPVTEIVFPPSSTTQRAALWTHRLDGVGAAGPTAEEIAGLAAAFRLGPRAIAAAVTEASLARGAVTVADLATAARRQGSAALAGEAQLVRQHFGWDDLVLPPDQLQQLHAIGDRIRHRALVHDSWGFAAMLGSARGTAVLFTGPSGTGKTMAAGVLSGSLGLELYRVDLAGVVSKYIGETEKNLSRVFAAAAVTDAVLFFDEADALFGKRTEVRDAHDRYANVEVAYLLQRIEEHDGLVVLSTNLRKNVDEAFLRRLQFLVEFPLPDRDHRRLIWQRMFPAAAPLDPALDLDLLADRFELSGGSIRNVAVEAAFAAAASGRAIGPDHVWPALQHEHQKLGRVASDRMWEQPGNGHVPLVRSAG